MFPRTGLLLSSVAPLSATLHRVVRSATPPYLVQCLPNWCRTLRIRAFKLAQHDEYLRIHTQDPASFTRVSRAPPFERERLREPQQPAQHPRDTSTTPAYTRVRARPNSRARTLPTNRHEGGSLT